MPAFFFFFYLGHIVFCFLKALIVSSRQLNDDTTGVFTLTQMELEK